MQLVSFGGIALALGLAACAPSGSGEGATGLSGSGGQGVATGSGGDGPAAGVGGEGTQASGVGGGGGRSASSTSTGPGEVTDFQVGGDRPVTVHVPDGFDGEPAPLVLVLHGYASTGALAEAYFAMNEVASARGVLLAAPDGLTDVTGARYWNGTAACCDYYDQQPDDVGYLAGLIDEIGTRVAVDPKRVYVLGHSNGGFMAYRMACDAAPRVAAIVSLSGATAYDPADCAPSEPVSVLEIHGTADVVVPYLGGFIGVEPFPSATETAATWADYDGCGATPESSPLARDVVAPPGVDADVDAYAGCAAQSAVELWTVQGGLHQPVLAADFGDQVLDFMLAHPKP